MTEINPPRLETKQIIKATLAALILGTLIFVSAVLPAEYGKDPLGTGKLLGLSSLYLSNDRRSIAMVETPTYPILKMADAGSDPSVPMPKEANNPAPDKQYNEREDSVTVRVPAGKGIEFKMNVLKYGKVKYEWVTDHGVLFTDFHGEVKEEHPDPNKDEFFESYTEAYSNNIIGTFCAPYEGRHGWYFKNKNKTDVVVSIRLKGQYTL
jgi:hypothetical protein